MGKKIIIIFVGILIAVAFVGLMIPRYSLLISPSSIINTISRPEKDKHLFDYADVLLDQSESIEEYLDNIRILYSIDAVIVSVPEIDKPSTIEEFAVEIFDNWRIGKKSGRGLLLLLVDDIKQVKLEVSLELEDVFTDAFSGYVEDMQLRNYYLSDQIGTGLVAVMEMLEERAQIKDLAEYDESLIMGLDKELLSGGGGAVRDLEKYEPIEIVETSGKYPAGVTVEETWNNMIRRWKDKVNDPNLGVYTELGKLSYRDFQNSSAASLEKDYRTWGDRPYEIIEKGDYAVVSFGNKKGWDNAPFLFCRIGGVWKFDMVNQRKYIRMGPAPSWGVEKGDHPYMPVLTWAPTWMNQDIPWEEEDYYTLEKDSDWAREMLQLEQAIKSDPNDFDILTGLGRINTITSMRPNRCFPHLKKAKQIDPDSPLPYKYLGIAHVRSTYQYKSAIRELKEFLKREPKSVFGHNFIGYCYYKEKDYKSAAKHYEKAIKLDPNSGYAYCKLSRAYGVMYRKAADIDPFKGQYRSKSVEMYEAARSSSDATALRLKWLKRWLRKKGISRN